MAAEVYNAAAHRRDAEDVAAAVLTEDGRRVLSDAAERLARTAAEGAACAARPPSTWVGSPGA